MNNKTNQTDTSNPTEILTQKHKPIQEHKYSFDEVFGISLTEYLNLHGKSIHALISEQEIDIKILESNYKRVSDLIKESTLDTESKEIKYKLDLAQEIKAKVLKKKYHLERLNEFRKGMDSFSVSISGLKTFGSFRKVNKKGENNE